MKGEAHEIRFADDAILCFQHRKDAEKVMRILPKRFVKYGLPLHPEKTRLIEFGRYAAGNAKKQGTEGMNYLCSSAANNVFLTWRPEADRTATLLHKAMAHF